MDRIFGTQNFKNEIVWHYGLGASNRRAGFLSKHDTIFLYSKTKKYTFNLIRGDVTPQMEAKYCHRDKQGKYMMSYGKKYYLKGGKPLDDIWDIPTISATDKERLGYPTQKPEALLERIIKASSNPTDIVLDPMCGCGTAIVVAHRLGRRWIGVDISPTACKLMVKRMRGIGVKIGNNDIIGLPKTLSEIKAIQPFEFQNWVIQKLMGRISRVRTGDYGIDGWAGVENIPVQVKQSEHVGRNVIDNFETAMRRENKTKGIIVAFSFGSGAYEEVARAKQKDGLEIELKTVEELLK